MRSILLSFDTEEFDIPLEFGQAVPEDVQFDVGARGLETVLDLLDRLRVRATFFVTANFAQHHEALILRAAARHEIASHGFFHSSFETGDLQRSRAALERITAGRVEGFRRARLAPTDPQAIAAAGYRYNSSENPTWVPGRYNNLRRRRTVHQEHGLVQVPISVTPVVRFPLFWLSFKNFPMALLRPATSLTLRTDGYLNIFYHPWEFTDLSPYRLPRYIKRVDGERMVRRLEGYLRWLTGLGEFETMGEFTRRVEIDLKPAAVSGPGPTA